MWTPTVLLIGYGLLMLIPTIAVAATFIRRRKRDAASAITPFTELRRRPAGESLRLEVEKLDGKIDEWLLMLVTTPVILAVSLTFDTNRSFFGIALFFLAAAVAAAIVQSRLGPLMNKRRKHHLGFQGERYVAEELNQVLADGFDVFHDVPFDNYNIDHIVIGSTGVFVVETKAKRKPVQDGQKKFEVIFDGAALVFPHGRDTDGLDQITRNVKSFSHWISSATGDRIAAVGILTIPGWYVTLKARSEIRVLNPKQIRNVITTYTGTRLDEAAIQRARHQLEQKCKLVV